MPAELAHELAPIGLSFYADIFGKEISQWQPMTWNGIHFPNRLGIAGGLDKNASLLSVWPRLGAGFVGRTVTPRQQKANPGKIMDRNWTEKSLWNKMGFPSDGAHDVANIISCATKELPIIVNIGKNRDTPNEQAVQDYLECVKILEAAADIFVVNVSSPNTKGLRALQNKESMRSLISALVRQTAKPILAKLSPDMTDEQLKDVVEGCVEAGCLGFVLTNTTLSRSSDMTYPAEGGVSGLPLAKLAKATLQKVILLLGSKRKDLLLISAGGVMSSADVFERLSLGADLVQTYSALIFNGPGFFHQVAAANLRTKGKLMTTLKPRTKKAHWIPVVAGFLKKGNQVLVGQRPETHSLANGSFPVVKLNLVKIQNKL